MKTKKHANDLASGRTRCAPLFWNVPLCPPPLPLKAHPRYRVPLALAIAALILGSLLAPEANAAAFSVASPLITARQGHTATLLPSGEVLIAGGVDALGGYAARTEISDPFGANWADAGPLLAPGIRQTATLLRNGKVLVVGGGNSSGPQADAQLYDPANGAWTFSGALNKARFWHTATLLLDGRVLVAGGLDGNNAVLTAELYDPVGETWQPTPALLTPRWAHTATRLSNGLVLVAGGIIDSFGTPTAAAEVFDPSTGKWTATTPMSTARDTFTASLLPDGKVLVAGGWNNVYLSSTELYDPATGRWTADSPMNSPRGYHTATVLPAGQVLVAGGQGNTMALPTAQLYTHSSRSWAALSPLNIGRQYHTETLLPDGTVLIAGGIDGGYRPLASTELWDPAATNSNVGDPLALALDGPGLTWVTGGDSVWTGFSSITHDGVDAAQSGSLLDNQESWLQTRVEGPGTLNFWWKVSSEADFDWLRFHQDGVLQAQISGEIDWGQRSFFIPAGSHTLRWRYVKDLGSPLGQDRAWVDQVSFTQALGVPVLAVQPRNEVVWVGANVTLQAVALGARPLTQQWYSESTQAIDGATNASLTLNAVAPAQAGRYHLVASNALGAVTSSVVTVTVTNNALVSQVLLFSDTIVPSPFPQALLNLGLTATTLSEESAFNSAVNAANRATTLVIVDAPQGIYAFNSLAAFIGGGGRVLFQAYSLANSPALADLFQVAIENRSTTPLPAYNWGGSPLLADLPSPIQFKEIFLTEDSQRLHALPGALPVAGSVIGPVPGAAAIVIGNGGRTIVNGFYAEGTLLIADGIQLAYNEIGFLTGLLGPPAIQTQPQDQFVALGANAVFGVLAVGAPPFTYQWRKEGEPIPGATGTNYPVTGVQSNLFGGYDVVVSSTSGSVTSRVAVLDLGVPLTFLQIPLSQKVVKGGPVTFSVEVSGHPGPFSYEWRKVTPAPLITNRVDSADRTCFYTVSDVQTNKTGVYRLSVRAPATPAGISVSFTLNLLTDTDGDGLPDEWELKYGFATNDVADAGLDSDGDGLLNREEYNSGTDPRDAASALKFDRILTGSTTTLEFQASSNKTYTIQCAENIPAGPWTRVANILARTTNHLEVITDLPAVPQRFYRLITPWQP